jgi:hypothetical protein
MRANAAEGGDGEEAAGTSTPAHRLTAALIDLSRRVAEDAGASWYLFDVPFRRSRTEFVSTMGSMDLPDDIRRRVISPLEAFEAAAAPDVKIFYEEGHLHFSPLGNRLAARTIFERLVRDSGARLARCRGAA